MFVIIYYKYFSTVKNLIDENPDVKLVKINPSESTKIIFNKVVNIWEIKKNKNKNNSRNKE